MLRNEHLTIAILVPALGFGGVERGVLEQARAFTAAGDLVWVIGARGPLVTALFESGARYIEAPLHRKDPIAIWKSMRMVRHFLEHEDVDVVEAVSRVPAWVAYSVLRRRKNRPGYVTSAHGFYRAHAFSRPMVYGDRIIAVSDALKEHLVSKLGADPDKVRVIHRGIDPCEFYPESPANRAEMRQRLNISEAEYAVGMVSRVRRGKGLEVLLEAGARLRADGIAVVLLYVGAGESPVDQRQRADRFRNQFYSRIAELNAQSWVRLIPPTREVNAHLNALDVAVVPSTIPEAFGRGVVEAMAAGIPVVATRAGAIPEIVRDGEEAVLFESGDFGELAQALAQLYRDPRRRAELASAGLALVRSRFQLSESLQATRRVLVETALLARNRRT
ncbi:MAG: glycosyltransferase family 4 protein [bacterium JZ-2024 1]